MESASPLCYRRPPDYDGLGRDFVVKREITTYPLTREQVQDELSFLVEYFTGKGIETCSVLFGFAWGNEYYPGKEWQAEDVRLEDLISKVSDVEASGIGILGGDDLRVDMPGLEFLFCHESDIHIRFSDPNDDIEFYYAHWKQLGYKPAEYLKNQKRGPGERVRFN